MKAKNAIIKTMHAQINLNVCVCVHEWKTKWWYTHSEKVAGFYLLRYDDGILFLSLCVVAVLCAGCVHFFLLFTHSLVSVRSLNIIHILILIRQCFDV